MRSIHPKPTRTPDPEILRRCKRLAAREIWAIVEGGPDDPVSGFYYAEAYHAALQLERKAVEILE